MKKLFIRGFTLIELVIVIAILGILAAFIVPRFVSLDTQARVASVEGLAGSVRSAAVLAHSAAIAQGNPASIVMEGNTVNLVNSYPDGNAGGIDNSLGSLSGYTAAAPGGGTTTFQKDGAPDPTTCCVVYTSAAAGAAPAIVVTTTGC